MGKRRQYRDQDRPDYDERIIDINRVAKVVKGGRRFAFRVVVVVGDNRGRVGYGIGKARSVPDAIRKALDDGRKNMHDVPMVGNTVPHEIVGEHSAARVLIKPAAPGTGIIAGGGVRAVLEAAGYRDILSKSLGSQNILNVIAATVNGLDRMKDVDEEAARRGKDPNQVAPFWSRNYG